MKEATVRIHYVGKYKSRLQDELQNAGYLKDLDILYGEWSETEGFFVKIYQDNKDGVRKIT